MYWRIAYWMDVLRLRRSVAATWLVCFDIRSDIVEERVEVQATGRRFGRGGDCNQLCGGWERMMDSRLLLRE